MYTIKILSNKEFDELPNSVTRGSYIKDSLGFADPSTNRAFVRHTAWPELNKYLIEHEFEHLVETMKTDMDENGICHKKKGGFFSFLDSIFNPVTWFHPERQSPIANFSWITGDTKGSSGGPFPVGGIFSPMIQHSNDSSNVSNYGNSDQPNIDVSSLGNIPNVTGQYGGTFSDQAAQTPSGMGPGAGGGSIGIMQPGLSQGGIALGAQNTLGGDKEQGGYSSQMSNASGFNGMSNMNFNDIFQPISF